MDAIDKNKKAIDVDDLERGVSAEDNADQESAVPPDRRLQWLTTTTKASAQRANGALPVTTTDTEDDDDEEDFEDEEDKEHAHPRTPVSRIRRLYRRLATHWRNSKVAIIWTSLFFLANVAAFAYKAAHYVYNRQDATAVFGYCIMFARGAANCLNLNCALILLPVSRHALTRIRGLHKLRHCFPFDSATAVHRIIGYTIAFWTLVHVGAHVGDFYLFSHANPEDIAVLTKGKLGIDTAEDVPKAPFDRWMLVLATPAAVTGVIMVLCMIVAYGCIHFQSRLGYNAFWYSHHLLCPVMLVALCVHGMGCLLEPCQSIYWLVFPLLLYMIPRLYRESMCTQPLQVLELRVKEGDQVAVLRLAKPPLWTAQGRRLRAGMYFNLNIPLISRSEWHPFSNTAAPSDPYLEFHIQKAGDWTGRLCALANEYAHVQADHDPQHYKTSACTDETWCTLETVQTTVTIDDDVSQNTLESCHTPSPKKPIHYWMATGEVTDIVDVDDLINGTTKPESIKEGRLESSTRVDKSIGVVGILEEATRKSRLPSLKVYVDGPLGASSQGFSNHRILVLCGGGLGATPMISVVRELLRNRGKMERTYFFWTFRNREALEWFASLLDDVFFANTDYEKEEKGLFVMRLYLTSEKVDGRASFVHRSKSFRSLPLEDSDRIQRINPHYTVYYGRPNWQEELTKVQTDAKVMGHKKAGVFVCGPPAMARSIQRSSVRVSKRDPKFHFFYRQETFCS